MQPTKKGGHPAETVGTSVKGKIGVSFFAGLFIAHDFLGSVPSICGGGAQHLFHGFVLDKTFDCSVIHASMRSSRANLILKVF